MKALVGGILFFMLCTSEVKLSVSRVGNEERIVVTGNLYYASVDRLAKHLRATPHERSVVDLTRVPYFDAFAASVIEAIRTERQRSGGTLELALPEVT